MPQEIQGVEYYSLGEVAERVGVHRGTRTRWRKDGHVPPGQWFPRGKQVLYTEAEVTTIESFAFRLEPIGKEGVMPAEAPAATGGDL